PACEIGAYEFPAATSLYTLTPCRLTDTRFIEGPALGANTNRIFRVAGHPARPLLDFEACVARHELLGTHVRERHGQLQVVAFALPTQYGPHPEQRVTDTHAGTHLVEGAGGDGWRLELRNLPHRRTLLPSR